MLPIVIDPKFLNAVVIGDGAATKRRLEMLELAGVKNVRHFKDESVEAGDIDGANIVYVADFDDEISDHIAQMVRSKNILLNIEDNKKYCDFHVPSITRKGDLLLTVSTNGKSPRLARRLRKMFDRLFSDKWADELDNIGKLRGGWRAKGYGFKELADSTDSHIESSGMMNDLCEKCQRYQLLDD